MKNSNHNQVVSLHQMWNTFNPSYIRDMISDKILYESFWVLRPIRGKEKFLKYIEEKLKTIKQGVNRNLILIESQVVHTMNNEDEYFLLLKQMMEGTYNESLIRVMVENGKIIKMGIEPVRRRFKVNMINDSELNNN